MNRNSLWAIALLLCSVLFLSSCANNDEVVSNQEMVSNSGLAISDLQVKREIEFMKDEKIIDQITYDKWQILSREQVIFTDGLPKLISTGVIEKSEEYRFSSSGEMDGTTIQRKDVQDLMKQKQGNNVSARMHRAPNMFASAGGTITVRVVESGTNAVSTEWKQALTDAIAVWNNLGLKVKFTKVTASNALIVGGYLTLYSITDTSDPATFAFTESIKSPGYFSERIYINKGSANTPDVNAKKYILIHELGHAIGMKHTNLDPNKDILGVNIFNTPIACDESNDANSFMYSKCTSTTQFNSFSSCDKQNLKYYWGY